MSVGVYKIINLLNNKVYIGKSLKLEYRWKQHLWRLKNKTHFNKHLQAAYNKYTNIYFWFEILEYCSKENTSEREMFYISKYQSDNPKFGYNKTRGGEGLKATEEIKQKISNSLKGKPASESKKENCRKAQTGLKRSIKHKEAIGKSQEHAIIQYTLTGEFIQEWDSIRKAAKTLGFSEAAIGRCVNNKRKTSNKFLWERKESLK